MKDVRIALITAILVLCALSGVSIFLSSTQNAGGQLAVSFLDVGQGDATLIESPSGVQVLIDGGRGSAVLRGLQKEMGFFDRSIDVVIATHPDADHIGGLIDVLKRYKVTTIVMTENINDTPVYELFKNAVEAEKSDVRYARKGQVYDLGMGVSGSTTLSILFPDYDPTNLESNMSSIIAQLQYGEIEYLLTGDSPKEIETYLVERGADMQSDVLKVGHHGSRTSTDETFLTAVAPTYAIISAGKDNSYGHPHKEVTELLSERGITTLSTADEGTITSISNGVEIWFK